MGSCHLAAFASSGGKFRCKAVLRICFGNRLYVCHCGLDHFDSRYGVLYLDWFSHRRLFKQKKEPCCLYAELYGLQYRFGGGIYVESLPCIGWRVQVLVNSASVIEEGRFALLLAPFGEEAWGII